jgi:protein gp37
VAESTGISWTDSTFNPWIGCTKVSPGCEHCYAEALDKRHKWRGVTHWGVRVERMRTSESSWRGPRQWAREAPQFFEKHGRKRRVFCASLADVFDNEVPAIWRADLFDLIISTQELEWLILTKRIGNVSAMMRDILRVNGLPRNVWLGISVVNQAEADRDIPKLFEVSARIRFLSCEPLLAPIDLTEAMRCHVCGYSKADCALHMDHHLCRGPGPIDWVIVGGESGPNFRVMRTEWAHDLRQQCDRAGVPFFFKQWGGSHPTKGGCNLGGVEAKAWPA